MGRRSEFVPGTGHRPNTVWKLSVTCRRSVVSSGYSGFLHQSNWHFIIITLDMTLLLSVAEALSPNKPNQIPLKNLVGMVSVISPHIYNSCFSKKKAGIIEFVSAWEKWPFSGPHLPQRPGPAWSCFLCWIDIFLSRHEKVPLGCPNPGLLGSIWRWKGERLQNALSMWLYLTSP